MPTRDSVIDITLSCNLKMSINDWRVCKLYNGSDHYSIRYNLLHSKIILPETRNYNDADWVNIKQDLSNVTLTISGYITEKSLDKLVLKLNKCLDNALEAHCPLLKEKVIDRNNPWWTP